jgi:hypothetical protein
LAVSTWLSFEDISLNEVEIRFKIFICNSSLLNSEEQNLSKTSTFCYSFSIMKQSGLQTMKELGDAYRALNMTDFACFCYMLDNRMDLIGEHMLLSSNSLSQSLEYAMARYIVSNRSATAILSIVECFMSASEFKEFANKLLFSLLFHLKAKMSKQELNDATCILLKLTNNSALSCEYLKMLFSSYFVVVDPFYLKYLDELKPHAQRQIELKARDEPWLDLCLMQFRSYQYQMLLEFFKQACQGQHGAQLLTIELFLKETTKTSHGDFVLNIGHAIVALFNHNAYEANALLKKALYTANNDQMEYVLELVNIDWIRDLLVHRVFEELTAYSFDYDYTANNDTLIWGTCAFSLSSRLG